MEIVYKYIENIPSFQWVHDDGQYQQQNERISRKRELYQILGYPST